MSARKRDEPGPRHAPPGGRQDGVAHCCSIAHDLRPDTGDLAMEIRHPNLFVNPDEVAAIGQKVESVDRARDLYRGLRVRQLPVRGSLRASV